MLVLLLYAENKQFLVCYHITSVAIIYINQLVIYIINMWVIHKYKHTYSLNVSYQYIKMQAKFTLAESE